MSKQQKFFEDKYLPQTDLSVCSTIKKGKSSQTRSQGEFNRLNKKIASLKQELSYTPEKILYLQKYYKESVVPLMLNCSKVICKACYFWDEEYEKKELSQEDLSVLSNMILDKCGAIKVKMVEIDEVDAKAINDIYVKHKMIQTGMSKRQLQKQDVQEMLNMFTFMTGKKPTVKMKKAKTEEEINLLIKEYLEGQMKESGNEQADDKQWQAPFNDPFCNEESFYNNNPKTGRYEFTRQLQEEQAFKSIRVIYMELVKELHPDREQDENLRRIKEERMKLLTEAYHKKDISVLLTMRINWVEESVRNLGIQTDEVLKGYNKTLRKELKKLEDEQFMLCYSITDIPEQLGRLITVPMKNLPARLKVQAIMEEAEMNKTVCEFNNLASKRGMKKEIKQYKKEKEYQDGFDDETKEFSMTDLLDELLFGKSK